jgi:hypothetical protein
MTGYQFGVKHGQGKAAEQVIYDLFQESFNVIPAPGYLQAEGVDFTFSDRISGAVYKVELKTDWTGNRTGNAFIETVSVARDGEPHQPGWAHTSKADWLLYFLPNPMPPKIYRITFEVLRLELPGWMDRYPARLIPNKSPQRGDYTTIGILVPLTELDRIAQEVIEV